METLFKVAAPRADLRIVPGREPLVFAVVRERLGEVAVGEGAEFRVSLVRVCVSGPRGEGVAVGGARLREAALLAINHAQVIPGDGVLRMQLDGASEGLLGLRELSAPIMNDAEIGVWARERGVALRELLEEGLRLSGLTRTQRSDRLFVLRFGRRIFR